MESFPDSLHSTANSGATSKQEWHVGSCPPAIYIYIYIYMTFGGFSLSQRLPEAQGKMCRQVVEQGDGGLVTAEPKALETHAAASLSL